MSVLILSQKLSINVAESTEMFENVRGCWSLSPPATKSQGDLWQVSKWHKDPWQFLKPLEAPLSPFKTLQVSSHAQQPWRGFQGLPGPSKTLRATPSTPQGTSGQFGNRHRGLDRPRKMPYNMGVRKTRFFKNLENLKIWFFWKSQKMRNLKKSKISNFKFFTFL